MSDWLTTTLVVVGSAEIVISSVVAVASPICYHVWTRGAWRYSRLGIHLMAYMSVIALTLVISDIRLFGGNRIDVPWFAVLRVIAFVLVPFVLTWRFWIIYRTVGPGKRLESDRTDVE
jgi:hypothetical protein